LELGERDPGYVDFYYGPAAWKAEAKRAPRSLDELAAASSSLVKRLRASKLEGLVAPERRRRDFLIAQLEAAAMRIRMLQGKKPGFAAEARGLFGVDIQLKPLSEYDPVLARIEKLAPGPGALADRVNGLLSKFVIPNERLRPVMQAAITECRRRTLRHIALPRSESFDLEFVTGKTWSGYNYYQGGNRSLIQVNTDIPARVSRAIVLGCHEGYPGHHVLSMLLEERLTKGRGWVEFSVYPLYSPQSLIAEGSANYGIELAFSSADRARFAEQVLYPLARLDPNDALREVALADTMQDLAGARLTIARDYLDGKIDRARAIELTQTYLLVSREAAEQLTAFADQYRSYVINYGLGLEMVRHYVERAGGDEIGRWAAMERIISEPTLPADLSPVAASRFPGAPSQSGPSRR
jgi:hypothetical protein